MIRLASINDTEQIISIYAKSILESAVTFEETVPSVSEFKKRIESIQKSLPYLVYEVNQTVVAYAYASNHRDRAAYRWAKELSVYVKDGFKGKGIAKALYSALIDILTELNVSVVLGGITVPNEASIQLHEKLGFKQIARYNNIGYKMGQWHDVVWLQLELETNLTSPAKTVRNFNEMVGIESLDKIISKASNQIRK